jgi:tetratricopeptide (TPR) repeat protein
MDLSNRKPRTVATTPKCAFTVDAGRLRSKPYTHRTPLVFGLLLAIVPIVSLAQQSQTAGASLALAKATKAYQAGDWKIAAEEYERVIRQDPENAGAMAQLGISYQKLGMLPEARASLERALRVNPDLPEVNVVLALVDVDLRQYQAAVPLLQSGLENAGYDTRVRLVAGERLVEIYFSLGKDQAGLGVVEKLLDLAPDNPDVLYEAQKVYATLWNHVAQRLLAKDPASYRIHEVLAEVAEAQGKFPEAEKEYRLVIKMEPELPGFHYKLGRILENADPSPAADEAALAEFQQELEISPQDVPTLAEVGEIYLKLHRSQDAAQQFRRCIELEPSYAKAQIGLGKVFLEQHQFAAATAQFERAVRLSPQDASAYYELMIADHRMGHEAAAERALASFQRLSNEERQRHSSMMKELQSPLRSASYPDR